jgi:hypothetical protein
MNLKSFGCSFIFGTDLADDGRGTAYVTPSTSTWPALLARHLGRSYSCHARPGAGNLQILEQVLNQVATATNQDLFVIGWTWIDRFDYYDANYNPKQQRSPWSTIMPIDTDAVADTYFRKLHSEYRDKFTSLICVKSAIDALTQKGIPFLMTYMDPLMYDQQWHTTPAVIDLQKATKNHMTQFEGSSFLEWSRQKNYEISPTWHPLESAHRAAADLMIKVFDKQNTSDPAQQVLS